MKTLILCDRESAHFDGLDVGAAIEAALRDAGGDTDLVVLNGDETHPCLGCFHCWVKTPGQCKQTRDAANAVARKEVQSDAVVFVSRITYGGFSYDTKSFLDRSIQNLAPFFEIVDGTMRHSMRYQRIPALISVGYGDCADAERETFVALAAHNARNWRTPRHAVFTARDATEARRAAGLVANTLAEEARP